MDRGKKRSKNNVNYFGERRFRVSLVTETEVKKPCFSAKKWVRRLGWEWSVAGRCTNRAPGLIKPEAA
jgi:hypothetical protein